MNKILIICQYFYPEQFRVNDIASEWVRRGHEVTVVTGIPNYPEGKFYPGYGYKKTRDEKWNGVTIHRIPLIPRGKNKIGMIANYFSFQWSGMLWARRAKIEADMVYMFETSPMNQCKVGVYYAKKMGIPCYLYVQDLWPENVEMMTGIHSPLVIGPIGRMVDKIYAGCTHIWGTSPSFVDEIRKRLPKNEWEKVSFLPQYAEEFYKPKEADYSKVPSTLDIDSFKVVFTGNIGKAQGLETLPKAARLINETRKKDSSIKDIKFVLVGDGRGKEDLLAEIHETDTADSFIFTGRVAATEVPAYLAVCDVAYISFMDNELFAKTIPAKLQSYMACGMPILAAARGETVRVIKEAECGFTVDLADEQALADAIIAMSKIEDEKLTELGQRAIEYNNTNFNKQHLLDEVGKIMGLN